VLACSEGRTQHRGLIARGRLRTLLGSTASVRGADGPTSGSDWRRGPARCVGRADSVGSDRAGAHRQSSRRRGRDRRRRLSAGAGHLRARRRRVL